MSNVQFEISGNIGLLTLDRPEKLNTVTPDMADEIIRIAALVNRDDAIRVVMLTGAGERAFCAGSDISSLDHYDSPWQFRFRNDYCDAIRSMRKPIVCAINGYAYGGGLEMAMGCDIRIASQNATFAAPEVKLGWVGGGGMGHALTHSIGPSNAAMMLLTGEPIGAEQAKQWGLITEMVTASELLERATAIADVVAERPPIAVQTAKMNIAAAFTVPLQFAIQYERDLQTICFATEDADEGREAFKNKRKPNFVGR